MQNCKEDNKKDPQERGARSATRRSAAHQTTRNTYVPKGIRGSEEHLLPALLPQPRGHLPDRGGLPHAVRPHEEQHRRAPHRGVGERDRRRAARPVVVLRRHRATVQHLGGGTQWTPRGLVRTGFI